MRVVTSPPPFARAAPPAVWPPVAVSRGVPLATVLMVALALIAINPIGYRGGGGDDWHYLQAARCSAISGFCVPGDHWWSRFPLVVPLGAVIALLGESRETLWIVPLAYALGAITLLVVTVQRQFGRLEALIAGLAFVATPAITDRLLRLNVDVPELAFVIAAVFCFQSAVRSRRAGWMATAGVLLGLAVQSRATALAIGPLFVAGAALLPVPRRHLPAFAAGLAAPFALEAAAYFLSTGDALHPWKLAMAHTRIPSTELAPGVDLKRSPLFNPAYIGGWRPSAGISVHWTIDGIINLLAHPACGLTLLSALGLLALHRRALGRVDAGGKLLLVLVVAAMLLAGALIYALAIDPKPRMFMALIAVASVCIGVLGARSWRQGSGVLVMAIVGLILCKGAVVAHDAVGLADLEPVAQHWIAERPRGLAIDEWSARSLTLVRSVRGVPLHQAAKTDDVLLVGAGSCQFAASRVGWGGWQVLRERRFDAIEPAPVAALRERRLFLAPRTIPVLCLLRPAQSATPM